MKGSPVRVRASASPKALQIRRFTKRSKRGFSDKSRCGQVVVRFDCSCWPAELRRSFSSRSPPPGPWLNVDRAADYLDTTPDAIHGMVKRGQVAVHRSSTGRLLFGAKSSNPPHAGASPTPSSGRVYPRVEV